MADRVKFSLIGVSAGPLTTSTAGTGDTALNTLSGTGHSVVADAPPGTGLTVCAEFDQVASNACSGFWTFTSSSQLYIREYIKSVSPFVATSHVMQRGGTGTGSGGTRGFDVSYNSLAKYRLFNAANTQIDETVNGDLLMDTWIRRETFVDNNSFRQDYYLVGSSVPFASIDPADQAANAYGSAFTRYTLGNFATTPTAETFRFTGVLVSDTAMPPPLESLTSSGTATGTFNWTGAAVGDRPLVETPMLCIVHRGIAASEQSVTLEESITGLQTLMTNHPLVSGVEVDVRTSTDKVCFLAHDSTGTRVHGFPETYESKSAAQLDALGVCRLADYLAECDNYDFREILVQHSTSLSDMNYVVDEVLASPVADRVTLMTSVSGQYGGTQMRSDGWASPRRIGVFGVDSSLYATNSAAFASDDAALLFTPPSDGAYETNRSQMAVFQAAGYQTGASTIDLLATMDKAHADGCHILLTNAPAVFESAYVTEPFRDGIGSGTFTWTGAASGKRAPKGSASGAYAYAGAATGARTPKGSAAGTATWTGAAVGKRTPKAAATGTATWAGAATGKRTPKGAITGTFAWSGNAVGNAPVVGSATGSTLGSYTYTGAAQGYRAPKGAATGTHAYAGAAVGSRRPIGAATPGTFTWVGTSAGKRLAVATAHGTYAWAGIAAGEAPVVPVAEGAGGGTFAWAGVALGAAPDPDHGRPVHRPRATITTRTPTGVITTPTPTATLTGA